jgi:hypothetical protein
MSNKLPLVIIIQEKGIKKTIQFYPEDALAIEEKYIENQVITIYHYLTFKIVITMKNGKTESVNVIDRELCVCEQNG